MIVRRILHKRTWSFVGPRFLYPSIAPQTPPPSPSRAHPFSSYASASLPLSNRSSIDMKIECYNSSKGSMCWFSSQVLADLPVSGGVVDVPLAQTGEGIAECELLKWFVREGDEVEEFQPLCEVQSDKATIEITSRYKGKVSQFLYAPGDIVKVGETLLKMVVEESQVPMQKHNNLEDKKTLCSEVNKSRIGGVLSTPAVRHLAKQYDINLKDIHATGEDGRVLKEDILRYAVEKGIIKDSAATVTAISGEKIVGDGEYQYVPPELGQHYDDKTVPLR